LGFGARRVSAADERLDKWPSKVYCERAGHGRRSGYRTCRQLVRPATCSGGWR
jgi:hypothetical protein